MLVFTLQHARLQSYTKMSSVCHNDYKRDLCTYKAPYTRNLLDMYCIHIHTAFLQIQSCVGPRPDADRLFAFLNVDGPQNEVYPYTDLYIFIFVYVYVWECTYTNSSWTFVCMVP